MPYKPRTTKTKRGSKRLMNEKHEAFVKNLVKYQSHATKAYSATYPDSSEAAAQSSASALLSNPNNGVKERFMFLEDKLAPEEHWAQKLIDLSNAKKGIYHNGKKVAEEDDNTAQVGAFNSYAKIAELHKDGTFVDGRTVNITVDSADAESMAKLADSLAKLRALREAKNSPK